MGAAAIPLLITSMAISTVGSVMAGQQANKAAQQEAELQRQQGLIAQQESVVDAQNEAYNQTQAVQRQRLAFLANGVSLEGSPSLVLDSSRKYGQSVVDSILRRGSAQKDLSDKSADITQNKGRAALIGGYMSAGSTLTRSAFDLDQAGAFDPKKGS